MKRLIILPSALLLILIGCDREDAHDIFKTRGEAVVEYTELPVFNAINVHNDINVVLTQGNIYAATIESWKNLMPKIHLSVDDNGVLLIEDKNNFNFVRSRDNITTIYLTFSGELNVINFSGNGTIMSNDTISISGLTILSENASGDVDLKLKTESIGIGTNHGNSASITITGASNSVGVTNWGYSPINLLDLKTSFADIHHHGLSNIYVNVSGTLSVTLYGVGNVYYTGNPSITLTRKGRGNLFKY